MAAVIKFQDSIPAVAQIEAVTFILGVEVVLLAIAVETSEYSFQAANTHRETIGTSILVKKWQGNITSSIKENIAVRAVQAGLVIIVSKLVLTESHGNNLFTPLWHFI